jgi:hypothetical protein
MLAAPLFPTALFKSINYSVQKRFATIAQLYRCHGCAKTAVPFSNSSTKTSSAHSPAPQHERSTCDEVVLTIILTDSTSAAPALVVPIVLRSAS